MDIYEMLQVDDSISKPTLQRQFDQLASVYETVYQTAQDKEIRQMAGERLAQLLDAGKAAGLERNKTQEEDANLPVDPFTGVQQIREKNGAGSAVEAGIALLPETAQKHALLARNLLDQDNSLAGCDAAMTELGNAIRLDPDNAAYQDVLEALADHARDVTLEQKRLHDEAIRQAEEEARAARADAAKKTAGAIGNGLLQGAGCCCGACCEGCGACCGA